jgi:hypothetical protein
MYRLQSYDKFVNVRKILSDLRSFKTSTFIFKYVLNYVLYFSAR